jgi:hypothetical protein
VARRRWRAGAADAACDAARARWCATARRLCTLLRALTSTRLHAALLLPHEGASAADANTALSAADAVRELSAFSAHDGAEGESNGALLLRLTLLRAAAEVAPSASTGAELSARAALSAAVCADALRADRLRALATLLGASDQARDACMHRATLAS